jgi:hypothetical protein
MNTFIILDKFLPDTEFIKDNLQKRTTSGWGRHVQRKEEIQLPISSFQPFSA